VNKSPRLNLCCRATRLNSMNIISQTLKNISVDPMRNVRVLYDNSRRRSRKFIFIILASLDSKFCCLTPSLDLLRIVRKYRYMELNLNQRKSALEEKIPDIKKSLGVVEFMIARVSTNHLHHLHSNALIFIVFPSRCNLRVFHRKILSRKTMMRTRQIQTRMTKVTRR
jgi:hypothetical protein